VRVNFWEEMIVWVDDEREVLNRQKSIEIGGWRGMICTQVEQREKRIFSGQKEGGLKFERIDRSWEIFTRI
jgi:hypothetical protein